MNHLPRVKIMDAQDGILGLLFEEGKKNYRAFVEELDIHPKTVRLRLDELIQKGIVREEGRETWKRGKPLFYSLTEKGEETTINTLLDNLNEVLKTTERMLSKILSEPATIEKWRKAVREIPLGIKITENMSLEEAHSIAKEEMDRIYGPLTRNLWLMHQIIIIIKTLGSKFPYKKEVFIHVNKEGGVHIIPKALLKEKGLQV